MKKQFILIAVVVAAVAFLGSSYVIGQEKAKEEAKPTEAAEFKVEQLVVGTGVENREPAGVAETFPATTEKVYCFLKAADIAKDTEVSFVWSQGEKELRAITLPLKQGPQWRTFSWKNIGGLKGDWKVELKDGSGKVLKEVKFKVE